MVRRSRPDGLRADRVAAIVDGRLEGDPAVRVTAIAEPEDAGAADLAFLTPSRRSTAGASSEAGVLLLPEGMEIAGTGVRIRVADPYLAAAKVLEELYPEVRQTEGVDPSAVVAADAVIGEGASIGPLVTVGSGARVGARTEVGPGCVIGPGAVIGEDCLLHANVTLYDGVSLGDRVRLHSGVVLGADGFGYARDGALQVKVPQVGTVIVEDDVEIGANACVDRGTFRATRIGAHTKIDNLVQIGHNCDIGRNCALSGLTGLAGSTVLEDGVITGGNVGTAGHQRIGKGAMVAAKSGVHGDVAPGALVGGYPQLDMSVWRRVVASLPRLPELVRRVRRLERAVERTDEE